MINVYAECSRCGEPIMGDTKLEGAPLFEAVKFFQVSNSGSTYVAIERDDKAEQKEFRQEYPLCPDCMKDVLEFVQGEYQPPRKEES